WLDEIYTHTLTADPDLGHALRALAAGVETHPPTYYLLLRLFTAVYGECSETALRVFALLAVVVALIGLYVLLRMAFAPLAAFAGVLAVWGHGLVIHHAFEARFYGPWLAATVWFAYFLARCRVSAHRLRTDSLLAVSSLLLCTIHYFGIITLTLIVGFELCFHRSPGKFRASGWLAVMAGPVALLACVPLLLNQRAAFTVPTWVAAPTLSSVVQIGTWVLLPASLTAVLVVCWFSTLFRTLTGMPR